MANCIKYKYELLSFTNIYNDTNLKNNLNEYYTLNLNI
jgi:hypothetical protein